MFMAQHVIYMNFIPINSFSEPLCHVIRVESPWYRLLPISLYRNASSSDKSDQSEKFCIDLRSHIPLRGPWKSNQSSKNTELLIFLQLALVCTYTPSVSLSQINFVQEIYEKLSRLLWYKEYNMAAVSKLSLNIFNCSHIRIRGIVL